MGKVTSIDKGKLTGITGSAPGFEGVPIEAAVERMAGLGITPDHIALVLGIKSADIAKYKHALELGRAKANVQVANAIFMTAVDRTHPKHATLAIFWARARMGWSGAMTEEEEAMDGAHPEARRSNRPRIGDAEAASRFGALMKSLGGKVTD